jgi:sugar/nucleoside kinase (ribokinase family)
MTGRVLVVGDVMTDVIVVPEGALVRGSDRRAQIRRAAGGSGANQAVWLASFGIDVRLLARVGSFDHQSQISYFRSRGVTPLLAADPALPSGVLVTIVDPDGERSFLTDRAANLNLSVADVPPDALDDTDYLVISGYSFYAPNPREVALRLFAEARERGIRIAIDPASEGFLREAGTSTFISWTRGASLIVANYDEAFALSGVPDLNEQVRNLGAHYDRVVVKRGAMGAVLGDAGGIRLTASAPPVDVVDTTGGGDAFIGAFIASEIRGESEQACLSAGVEAGTRAVQELGGQPLREPAPGR